MRGAENGGLLFLYGVLAVVVSHQSQTRQADYESVDSLHSTVGYERKCQALKPYSRIVPTNILIYTTRCFCYSLFHGQANKKTPCQARDCACT
jgi:hypothetical protein